VRRFVPLLLLPLPVLAWALVHPPADGATPRRDVPAHHGERTFRNLSAEYHYTLGTRARRAVKAMFERGLDRGPALVPVANDLVAVRANGHRPTATWVGHSTFLLQLDGVNILTDPVWSDRVGPTAVLSARRLVPPGVRFEDLPPIHAVLISHDHYDHLDEPTVLRIAREHPGARFFVPLGIKAWLRDRGVTNAEELDWWEAREFAGLRIVGTPAQHNSGRGPHDQNRRLWSSWAVLGETKRVFFAGDTGYWTALREIGDRLGPFDLALIPIGGYVGHEPRHPNHVNPEEAVQVFEDVRGERMVPMHWGTFEMNREPFDEPPARLRREAERRGLTERVTILAPGATLDW
jgi:N-acyl-phosphatidylethanolamine-hydrolysing phospholipase D